MKTEKSRPVNLSLSRIMAMSQIVLVITLFSSGVQGQKYNTDKTVTGSQQSPADSPQDHFPGQKEGDAYNSVDEMPLFPGGDSALLRYIAKNTIYPKEAKDKNIQGRVIIRFKVQQDGTVSDPSILKGVDGLLDNESLRVVSTLPRFTPGKLNGINVPVWYRIPITFTLKGDNPQRPSRYEVTGADTVYSYTGEMPRFPGGNEALAKFKSENVKYPPEIKSLGIEGVVYVSFIVENDGSISGIKIMRGASPSLDSEALRVTKLMPPWQPGKEKGKPVKFITGTTFDFLLKPRQPIVHEEGAPFIVVEEMPVFPGGDSALLAYISQNTKYPETAKAKHIEGRVIVRFCVTDEGGIDRISILKGVDPEVDVEAMRVVKELPSFKPGMQGGKPVPVWYMVPITFTLGQSSLNENKNGAANKSEPSVPGLNGYDEIPVFPGGEREIYKFINSNLVYPQTAKEKNISGKVMVIFLINPKGLIDEVKVVRGVDPALDEEAVRVIKMLPAWEPAKLSGLPVHARYLLPVTFDLQ